MKKVFIILSITSLLLFLFGCSTPAYVQKDDSINLSNYKKYMWVNTSSGENDKSERATAFADIGIHNAVNAELNNKWGWKEVSDNPDILLSYDVLVERNTETTREPVYSQSMTRYYYNPYTRRWATIYYPAQFQGYDVYETPVRVGTVTITMVDAKTDKNIWQGWTTERLNGSRITDTEIKKSVKNIFNKSM